MSIGRRISAMLDRWLSVDWNTLFVPSGSLAEIVLRGSFLYLALVLIFRIVLKRQMGVLGVADLLVIVIVADAAQNAIAGQYRSITEGALLVLVIALWDLAIDWLSFRVPAVARFIHGAPLPLIR